MQLQQSSHAEMMRVLNVLDKTLEPRTFLVGDSLTLADIAVATAALLPFKYVSQVFMLTFIFLSYLCILFLIL